MNFSELAGIVFRRWYALVAAVIVAGVLLATFMADGGVYSSRTIVTFTLPQTSVITPGNGANDGNVVAFAGVVAGEVNNGRAAARYSTDDAPFYGAGIREGVLIAIPNAGNQWYNDYSRAEIEIEVVGRTREWVEQRQDELVTAVLAAAEQRQASLVADSKQRIAVEVMPLTLAVQHIAPSGSQKLAAAAALAIAALLGGAWLAVRMEARASRRLRRRGRVISMEGAAT
ncbi:hypothetical protein AAIB33_17315 [Microbacterium sp. AZCO]|uniref:hypothetical protein n=1 Tax=Microbacterium sp. AZCO TaxID=3142976 RepID=UPI0031F3CDAB